MEGRHYAGPGPAMQKQMPQSAYMRAESREIDDANVYDENQQLSQSSYRYYQNMCTQRMDSIRKPFYSIPSSFIFPTPSISEDQIKSFSVFPFCCFYWQNTLLFYIFYLMPNDRLQVWLPMVSYGFLWLPAVFTNRFLLPSSYTTASLSTTRREEAGIEKAV